MGIAYYVSDATGGMVESRPVTGASEGTQVWVPLIQALKLELLDVVFSGGLTVSREYHNQMVQEVTAMRDALQARDPGTPVAGSPSDRCQRLLDVLIANPPDGGNVVYIG